MMMLKRVICVIVLGLIIGLVCWYGGIYLVHRYYIYGHQATPNNELTPQTHYLWNRMFAKYCDWGPRQVSCDTIIYDCIVTKPPPCDKPRFVYVVTTTLKQFIKQHLHCIQENEPIVLITGCADRGPRECIGWTNVNLLLNQSKKILHWYAQNLDFNHPRATALPIGLDYHTFWNRRGPPFVNPLEQEKILQTIIQEAPPVCNRSSCAYVQFGRLKPFIRARLVEYYRDRSGFVVVTKGMKREMLWREYTKYFFIVSPRGEGIDCHRMWEALILGCAVIVEDVPLNRKLLSHLPAVFVKDNEWKHLTRDDLCKARKEIENQWHSYAWEKLTCEYWYRCFSSHFVCSLKK